LGSLYESQQFVEIYLGKLAPAIRSVIRPRIVFSDNTFTFNEMARLYQAADCYISPYLAEGFNMPVMEACACGLPVICSAGGPTDEFTRPEFAMRIKTRKTISHNKHLGDIEFLTPDRGHTRDLMLNIIANHRYRNQARNLGPRFMAEHFTWRHIIDQLLTTIRPGNDTNA
jgi:glycosyltransferase involved in cell wall biosynthesis